MNLPMEIDVEKFKQEGYAGPYKFVGAAEVQSLLDERFTPPNLTWYKSPHEKSAPIVRTASSPAMLAKLRPLLGNDILLWGSHFICQRPGQNQCMHIDVEHGRWDGVTVWLALKNLDEKTTLSLITRSHAFDTAPNVLQKTKGLNVDDNDAVLAEARELDPRCELKTFRLNPGEIVIWSGRAWHGTVNKSDKTRFSIIMQYCTPDNVARIPLNYEYPDTKWSDVQPPCVLVSGEDRFRCNKVLRKEDLEPASELVRKLYAKMNKARYAAWALKRKLFP